MIKLFELGENKMVTLDKDWISLIPEFRRLLARDKGGPGDGSGKYKKQATREFTFIYLMYDFRSPLENMSLDEREEESLRCADLTKGKMESDGDLWEAIRKYEKMLLESSPTLQSLRDLREATEDLRTYIKAMSLEERTFTGAKVHSPKEKQEAINGMPKTLQTIADLERQVREELDEGSGLRGDATKGEDEDPDEED